MKKFPKAQQADICLLLEGTFPFVRGGVSTWVYQLINNFPQYKFAAVFLGGNRNDYTDFLYPLPENLVHLQAHFLFDEKPLQEQRQPITDEMMQLTQKMHEQFKSETKMCPIENIKKLLLGPGSIKEDQFMHDYKSWNYIKESYLKNFSEGSFVKYFWNIRNLHKPIWELSEITQQIPKVKLFHSISTGYAGFLAALLHLQTNLPFVLTEHGIYTKERWIDLLQNYWLETAFQKKLEVDVDVSYLVKMWIRFFEVLALLAYESADPIISLFSKYRDRQIAGGAPANKTKIIPNGVDLEKFSHIKKKQPAQEPIIALIGRVVPIKDVKTFIRAVAIALKKIPTLQAWIVGSCMEDPEYVQDCKSLIKLLNIENITFKEVQEISVIFEKIDLLVLSSISEGLPLTILESFAAGVPVVSTDVGACSELIFGRDKADSELGVAGKIVAIADPTALANAICELLQHKEQWQSAKHAALQRVKKYYSAKDFKEKYQEIYSLYLNK